MENLNTFPEGWMKAVEAMDFLPEGTDPNAFLAGLVFFLFAW